MSKNSKKNEETEKLIQIAVKFLSNPKVETASDEVKRNFLKKKGYYFIIYSDFQINY